jgi:MFS family permease
MVLVLLCTAQFVVVLDVTIVAVSLPAIQADVGGSVQWVATAYSVAFGGLLVPAGRASDVLGRRRLFGAGLAVFAVASVGCGLCRSPAPLVALRALQGVGAAALAPAALSLVTQVFADGEPRRRALAAWTAAAAAGGATGWVLGGLLNQTLGWPAVFFVNGPLGLAAIVAARRLLPAGRRTAEGIAALDLPGAAAATAGMAALVLGLSGQRWALVPAAAALGLFVAVERRAAAPLVPRTAWREPVFVRATLVALALTAATSPAMLLSVLHQQRDLGHGATETGLMCVPFSLAVVAGSLLARGAPRATMLAGLAGVAAGAVTLAVSLVPGYLVMGLGLGAASVASTAAATAALGSGAASGMLTAAAQVGTALGVAALVGPASYRVGLAGAAGIALAGMLAQARAAASRSVAAASRSVART